MKSFFQKNSILLIILVLLLVFFVIAQQGMGTRDFLITTLRGFSAGSVTFLVAAGFSLIFGLLDVLNLAQGTLYMVGAYIGWTVYVRPDTFIDLLTPLALILCGFTLSAFWKWLFGKFTLSEKVRRFLPWGLIAVGVVLFALILPKYPVAIWDLNNYAKSPVSYAFNADQVARLPVEPAVFENIAPGVALAGLTLASLLFAAGLALFGWKPSAQTRLKVKDFIPFAAALALGVAVFFFNNQMTDLLLGLDTTWLFVIALAVAVIGGAGMGALIETVLIRPLYSRPIYQLMLTIGLSYVGIQVVQAIWGRNEFTMPTPSLFRPAPGVTCPSTSLAAWFQDHCSTILVLDGRVRMYDEVFIPLVGIVVLVAVWILLKRTRLGMIIRAGVQDREMVEALGINVRQVFTLVFALGVGLATFGGAIAAPSTGLSNAMGESLLLSALIALAIGGLTSYPGAALGALLVGLIQQFVIKYGQIGIPIPFTDIVFKPSPPLVPASTVLLMVIVLLIFPGGLLGKKE
jgi:branched-chain amino acid transport system permease protein